MERKEFEYAFRISRMVIFEVGYSTYSTNSKPYFSTSAGKFVRNKRDWATCGQCQHRVLTGKAHRFWKKWDHKHLKDLTDDEYIELLSDIEELKDTYQYLMIDGSFFEKPYKLSFRFDELKELSMYPDKKNV